jgi:pyruvate/2-oxoglutarate dehydrogenase complex dihydrolipoamide dehydrogenase (E3) component
MSAPEPADVVVIGLGPGGEHAAGTLAEAGLDVVGVDELLVGGECPYWGCVPSKMMIRGADLLAEARRIPGRAGSSTVEPDWAPIARRIRDEATDTWDDTVAVERFEGQGGRFVRGHGRITAPGQVEVTAKDGSTRAFTATRGVVVASGSHAAIPPVVGLADTPYWTNRQAIEVETLPRSLIVVGGGAIGVELAQVFVRFGVQVTIIESTRYVLDREEPEVGPIVEEALKADGIAVRCGVHLERVAHDGTAFTATISGGDQVTAERLLVATGRRVDLAAVGLGAVGVDESLPGVPVDENLKVADGVWALGDVTNKGMFTHVSMYQAAIVAADVLGQPHAPADYKALPRVTFTDPEVGSVGLTEKQARDEGLTVRTGLAQVGASARGWIHGGDHLGIVKVVEDTDRGVLVGATAMGPSGGEVLGLLALAVHAEIPVEQLRTMIYAYPTFHRGIEDAVRDLSG